MQSIGNGWRLDRAATPHDLDFGLSNVLSSPYAQERVAELMRAGYCEEEARQAVMVRWREVVAACGEEGLTA